MQHAYTISRSNRRRRIMRAKKRRRYNLHHDSEALHESGGLRQPFLPEIELYLANRDIDYNVNLSFWLKEGF